MDFTLGPKSSWDDQGLWFTLVVNTILLAALSFASFTLLVTPVLWLRRLYRTNHTTIVVSSPGRRRESDTEETPLRAAHVGRALPYRSSLFSLPSWRSWLSVEEDVEHLEGVLPHTAATRPIGNIGGCENMRDDESSRDSTYSATKGDSTPPEATAARTAREKDAGKEKDSVFEEVSRPSGSSGGLLEETSRGSRKAPLDPQVALYLAFLKLFATVFIVGGFINVWICAVSGTDNYIEHYMVRRDIHHCRRYSDDDKTACVDKAPFCQYIEGAGCYPVALNGLYDLSVQNIAPRSWRLWLVGVFDLCFCTVYFVSVIFFLHHVDAYIRTVMRLQMKHALGHRVAVVRGLKDKIVSESEFRQRYLVESAYFPPRPRRNGGGGSGDGEMDNNCRGVDDDDDDDRVYYQCDCTGLGCLFSIVGFNYYKTTRWDAVFTRDGSVKQLLFPRKPPHSMYKYMEQTEKAMEALQEAVADQKASLRRQRQEQMEPQDDVLMMRAPFPSCCTMVPRIEYWKEVFLLRASKLNNCIDIIPESDKKGSAFVVFADALSAYEFVNLFESLNGVMSSTRATIAGPPDDIIHINVTADRHMGWLRTLAVVAAFTVLLFFWSLPVGFLGSLDNISRVPGIGGALYDFYMRTPETIRGILTAYLPVVVLALFNVVLPFIIRGFVVGMGAVNRAEHDGGELHLQYLFMVLTGVVFQAALQGGLFQLADLIADPTSEAVINFFVALVSPQGGYWYAKVITAACVSTWINLVDPVALLMALLRRKLVSVQRVYDSLFNPCVFEWAQLYSFDLTILAMGLLFHMTVPLLALFVGLYFVVRYMTQRCRLYDRYRPTIHPLHDCTVFTASAQALRAASWLYCAGGIGGVLFMSLRGHVGGVVLCSISLAVGMLLLTHVHMVSRRWIASLANARRFLSAESVLCTQYGTSGLSVGRTTTPTGGVETTPESPNVVEDGTSLERLTRSLVQPKRRSKCDDSEASSTPLMEGGGGGGSSSNTPLQRSITNFYRNILGPTTELLPRVSNINSRYQPKHQQLVHIDAAQEIQRLEATEFVVERYWDGAFEVLHESDVVVGGSPVEQLPQPREGMIL
ncbi:hypothetical protein DQ04_06791020 [Trypanosoma grayi]|uniref:hypothetical protein n=1 Tax=Trypanosoma grayi TaxID=71804 RepID=UPI0004F3FCAD|nr:hypothetical protein DQ04_06791020 [Trypanosoma grayi]KEG08623.1 hypothetical protein DQ04_06791020 [Trypanosoma grayi]